MEVKSAYTTKELVTLMGITRQAIDYRARRESWHSRPRAGRGGGSEWLLTSMPKDTRSAIALALVSAQEISSPANVSVPVNTSATAVNSLATLPPSRRDRAEARAHVVQLARRFAAVNAVPRTVAYELFSHEYNTGAVQVAPSIRAHLPKICRASLCNWERAIDNLGIASLCGKQGQHRIGTGALDQPYVLEFCLAHIFKFPHAGPTQIYRGLEARLARQQRPEKLPSQRRVQSWYQAWRLEHAELFLYISNPDAYRNKCRVAFGDAAFLVDRLNQEWEMDSTPSDLLLADGKRHTIVACIDLFSRRVTFHVSRTSSSHAVATCLRKSILAWGVPEIVRTDNGQDYVSNHIDRVLLDMKVLHEVCNPFSPEEKPFVERVFKSFLHDNMELLTGFTGHSVSERKALEARKSFAQRMFEKDAKVQLNLSPEELQKVCDGWANNTYAHRVHSKLGMTPYEKTLSYDGPIRQVQDEGTLGMLFLPCASGDGLRKVSKDNGINIFGDQYIHSELALHIGKFVQVRIDDDERGRIYVYNMEGTQFICIAQGKKYAGLTSAEVRNIAIQGRHLQKEKMSAGRAALVSAAKSAKVEDTAYERMLNDAERARRIEAEHPLRFEALEHTSPALEGAAQATVVPDYTPTPMTDEERHAQVQAQAALAQANAAPKPAAETPEHRYWRFRQIKQALEDFAKGLGPAISSDDAAFFERYGGTPERDAQEKLFLYFGNRQNTAIAL